MSIRNVLKHELIGRKIEIVGADNKSLIGLKGTIIDETKNMLTIKSKDKVKRVIKKQVTLRLNFDNRLVEIKGKDLAKRPEERIK